MLRSTLIILLVCTISGVLSAQNNYPIVDTNISEFYSNSALIQSPKPGDPFFGQDASYSGNQPSYTDNGKGTVTDKVTGLVWQQKMGSKITFAEALNKADTMTLGGYTDWRIPTIKELYSLALFTGRCFGDQSIIKFIDTTFFDQPIGDVSVGEREIDAQVWSETHYVDEIMNGDTAIFGFNFIDGRLKGYPKYSPRYGTPNKFYFRMVRGNSSYGVNRFVDNGDGTIIDEATGLMWQQADNGTTYDWEGALYYAEELTLAGYDDWRLPNAKELQSIVDYTRSPGTSSSPAIDPVFSCTQMSDPEGNAGEFGFYWSSTTLQDGHEPYSGAVYVCFGRAQGKMEMPPNSGNFRLLDVHGAGAQRSDPKSGDPSDYPQYFGPQGDVRYVFNFVRCVRDVDTSASIDEQSRQQGFKLYPNPSTSDLTVEFSGKLDRDRKIEIVDLSGRVIQSICNVDQYQLNIDTSAFYSGSYLLRLFNGNGVFTRRFIVI